MDTTDICDWARAEAGFGRQAGGGLGGIGVGMATFGPIYGGMAREEGAKTPHLNGVADVLQDVGASDRRRRRRRGRGVLG